MLSGIKRIFSSGSRVSRGNVDRATELLGESRQIEGMEAMMKILARILRLSDHEDHSVGTGLEVDGRGPGDADLGSHLSAGDGRGGFVGGEQGPFQQLRESVGIEGVEAAMLGRHVK